MKIFSTSTGVPFLDNALAWIDANVGRDSLASLTVYGNVSVQAESYGITAIDRTGQTYTLAESVTLGVTLVTPSQADDVPAAGGSGSFTMEMSDGLSPVLHSTAGWLTFTRNGAVVQWQAAANADAPRNAAIQCGGQPGQAVKSFVVWQMGAA